MSEPKKLYRSNSKMIAGICAGIAEYFEVDPTIIRIVYAILTVFTLFSGIIRKSVTVSDALSVRNTIAGRITKL